MTRLRDSDVRRAVHARVLAQHRDDPNTLVLDEFGVHEGASRIDIAVVNGRLDGFEIKSDSDTLDRLPGQVKAYGAVFDHVTLVVGTRLFEGASAMIPWWWGVKLAECGPRGAVQIRTIRAPRRNHSLDLAALALLLWRDELESAVTRLCPELAGPRLTRRSLADALAQGVTVPVLRDEVRRALKARTGWSLVTQEHRTVRPLTRRCSRRGATPPAS